MRRRQSTAYTTQHSLVTGTVQYMLTWSRKCQAGDIRYVRLSAPTMHAVKCYRGALEKLVAEKPHYKGKGKGKLTVAMQKRLTTAARCAIKMQSTGSDVKRATELLQQDLRNGPLHCSGVHTNCSTDYCKVTRSSQIPDTTDILIPEHASSRGEESTSGTDEDGSISTVAAQEEQLWLTLHHMYDDYTAL